MTYVTYTATRNLAPGHDAGTSYTLDLAPFLAKRLPREVDKDSTRTAMSGKSKTNLLRIETYVDIATNPLTDDQDAQIREFLGSIAGKKVFQFDELGTPAVPIDPVPARILRQYTTTQANTNPQYTYSFSIRTY